MRTAVIIALALGLAPGLAHAGQHKAGVRKPAIVNLKPIVDFPSSPARPTDRVETSGWPTGTQAPPAGQPPVNPRSR